MYTDGVAVREIVPGDLDNGFLESLDALRPASGMDRARARGVLGEIMENPRHIVAVATVDGAVAGTATLLIERKFIHDGGLAGHIEDVAVRASRRGRGIGRMLVEYLLRTAAERGCYRTTLDCRPELAPFYEGIGFRRQGDSMRYGHR